MRFSKRRAAGHLVLSFVVLFLAAVPPLPARAQGVLPAHVSAQLEEAANEARTLIRRDSALAGVLATDRRFAAVAAQRARRSAAGTIGAAVVGAIARNPALVADIVAAAVAATPQFRAMIVNDATRAFPGFAQAIVAAGGAPAPTAPIRAPGPTPAPAPEVEDAGGGVTEPIHDPHEWLNRGVFYVNDRFDTFLIRPLAQAYGFVTPDAVKRAVRNFLRNLGSPARFANDLLQGEVRDAGVTGARFLVNSTVGVAGLLDVAEAMGHRYHRSDFGQTLHSYGVGPGRYVIIPIFGPRTLRDSIGLAADTLLDPLTYLLGIVPNVAITGGGGVVRREELLEVLDDMREGSVDYYAAVRSLYYQDRAVELRRGRPADTAELDVLFGSFE